MSNDPRRPRRPRQGGGDPVNDIERFLKEVDRLRRKAGDEVEKSDSGRVEEVQPVEPVRPRRPVARPTPRPKPRPRVEEAVPVMEVQPVQEAAPAFVEPPPPPPPPPPVFVARPSQAEAAVPVATAKPAAGAPRRGNAAAARIRTLLQANNLRTAVLLREILDAPRCRRRR
jgi:outer membrane biosynthesis protein TonB